MEIDFISILVGVIAAGGGGALVAFNLFKWLGDAWLQAKFNEKMEADRHERAKELERLRAKIDGELRAGVRLQEKQFEACLAIWDAMKDAQSALLASISPFQEYLDISKLDEDGRKEHLSSFNLQSWQVREILEDANIQKKFEHIVKSIRFNVAAKAFSEFDRISRSYELFFEPDTFSLIRDVADAMHSSLVSKQISIEERDHKMGVDSWKEYNAKCVPSITRLVPDLKKMLRVTRTYIE